MVDLSKIGEILKGLEPTLRKFGPLLFLFLVVLIVVVFVRKRRLKQQKNTKGGIPKRDYENEDLALKDVETVPFEEDDVYLLTKINERLKNLSDINKKFSRIYKPIQSKLTLIRPIDSFNRTLGEITLGYPVGIREELNDYVILYRAKPPTFGDYIAEKLGRLFGRSPQYAILRVPKAPYTIFFSEEYITVLAEAIIEGPYNERLVVPLNGSLLDAKRWIMLKKENTMLWALFDTIALRFPNVVRSAMEMNPRLKTYFSEKQKDQAEGKEQQKFGGLEMEFQENLDPFKRFKFWGGD